MDTIRIVFTIVAQNQRSIYQIDVKSTFLNGYLEEEVYVEHHKAMRFQDKKTKYT